ncbi:MAG: purine-binding chemotaxis protein CheW [Acidobacteria bacterium]|nr:purine-binding chemotaxis protein CheW [Acidobacteriota bacterium]
MAPPGKYLTFALSGEEYGLPVLTVREIIKMMDITPVPQSPHYVRGVVNLRGKVIPIVDLRRRLGFPDGSYDERTCIIVAEIRAASAMRLMGVVVDAVSEVLAVTGEEIEPPPTFGGDADRAAFVKGVTTVKGKVKLLLDLDAALGDTSGF